MPFIILYMRTINLNVKFKHNSISVIQSDKLYSVLLPSKALAVFQNKTAADKFVKDSEKMFTNVLYELNEIYYNTYSHFRMFLFNTTYNEEMSFEGSFASVKMQMQNAWKKSVITGNGYYYLYKDTQLALSSQKTIIRKLDNLYKRIKVNQRLINNKNILKNIEAMELQLKNWGWKHHQPHSRFKEMNISKYEHDFFKSYPLY